MAAELFTLNLKSFNFDRETFYKESMNIVVDDIILGIKNRRAITGGDLPQLEKETIELKGHDAPLINKGLFTSNYTYQRNNMWQMNTGKITIRHINKGGDTYRDESGAILQLEGVGKKQKKFYFFGVSKDSEQKIMSLADELITKALKEI